MRIFLIWIAALYVFGSFYVMVEQKRTLRRDGQTVYLALAPRDPRSLMQGDYMALSYAVTNEINHLSFSDGSIKVPQSGALVISLDAQNVGQFVRLYQGEALAPGEHLLKYHHQSWATVIGAEQYFIPEGSGNTFANASFGELKVALDGTPLLVALCDQNRQPLTVPATGSGH